MDYGKSGNPKAARDRQAAPGQPLKGAPLADASVAAKKAALLARMKAATKAKAKG
jgi:hypothetical protein